jgi:hypothetical protein
MAGLDPSDIDPMSLQAGEVVGPFDPTKVPEDAYAHSEDQFRITEYTKKGYPDSRKCAYFYKGGKIYFVCTDRLSSGLQPTQQIAQAIEGTVVSDSAMNPGALDAMIRARNDLTYSIEQMQGR